MNQRISYINAVFLATCSMWSVYDILPGTSLAYVLIIILVLLNINNYTYISYNKVHISWFVFILLFSLFGFVVNSNENYFSDTLFYNNLYSIFVFFIALVILTLNVDLRIYKKSLIVFGLLVICITVYQRFQLLFTGSMYKDFYIPGIPLYRPVENLTTVRPSACFSEPAHLSIFLLPIFNLFLNDRKFVYAMLCGIAILCTGSTTGFIIAILLLFVFAFKQGFKIKSLLLYTLILSITIIFILKLFPSLIGDNIERLNDTENESFSLRLIGPIVFFNKFNTSQFLFGIGFNQLESFGLLKGISLESRWRTEGINANYANAFLFMVISYGIAGGVIFVKYIYSIYKKYNIDLGALIILIGIICSDQVLFKMNLLYPLVYALFSPALINNSKKWIYEHI